MTTPDVGRLARRTGELDESLRAVGDTVLDIKETVDGHTLELAAVRAALAGHDEEFAEMRGVLTGHTGLLQEILRRLETR